MSIRRLGPLAAIVAALLCFAGITPAGAVGGLFTPGQIKDTGSNATAFGFDSNNRVFTLVQAQTGFETFRSHGGSLTTIDTGIVNISFDAFGENGQGCWLFPKENLVVNSDLSATLTFDSSDPRVTECPGDPVGSPVEGSAPGIGPSGLVFGLQEPLKMTVTWAPAGPVTSIRSTSRMSCKPFASVSEGSGKFVDATAAGSAQGTFADSTTFDMQFSGGNGNVSTGSSTINISGPPSAGCGPF